MYFVKQLDETAQFEIDHAKLYQFTILLLHDYAFVY